jgi:hypothetical protein
VLIDKFNSALAGVLFKGRFQFYVCRPLNGKHKFKFLCVLCGSAVEKIAMSNE